MFSFYCHRGVSYTFGHDVIQDFLGRHDLDLICRAHQVVEDGYKFQANRQLVTIFSAPNYCGEFDNAGAILVVKEDLVCSFKVMRPNSHRAKLEEEAADLEAEYRETSRGGFSSQNGSGTDSQLDSKEQYSNSKDYNGK
jgi:hypothetical protein